MGMPESNLNGAAGNRRKEGRRPSPLRGLLGGCVLPALLLFSTGCQAATPAPSAPVLTDQAFLDLLERRTFQFFWDTADPTTGLVPDRYPTPSFASISAVGFGLTAYVIGAERGYVTRDQAAQRVLLTLRFLDKAPQGDAATGIAGYKGFYYHFLDMKTGLRYQKVELSSIDTALLLAGALTCRAYFDQPSAAETEIRDIAVRLNARADWAWFSARPNLVSMGWTPEEGFNTYDWHGYMEGMLLVLLAMGSPAHPVSPAAWPAYTATQKWGTFEGQSFFQFGPLFGHQFSHIWVDFRGIRDAASAARDLDYAENTRRATYAQRAYALRNPGGWKGYGANGWGISACDGPVDGTLTVDGTKRTFLTYAARGAGGEGILDDGTLTPNAAAGSMPFTPEISLPALQAMRTTYGDALFSTYGFLDAYNPTFPVGQKTYHGRTVSGLGWFDTDYLGIDQGLILTMIENHRSGLVWNLMKRDPTLLRGLALAGFKGGWVDAAPAALKRPVR
ncbi:hypothetical protein METESE_10080 [Mesoterricola sediminis]|uniref:Glycoamylase-like domain-containing protein n=2 Tax=Mesoterricola sediminis TaxID=2927980 RepID=A0AA48GX82_9BACT|nr:hypothetical protein METESE_10080 [Mesoterricola sediminis]